MDLTDLRLEVRERLGETTADFFTNDEVDRAINEAVRRFCAEEQWPFLLTEWTDGQLAADDDELDFPQNVSLTRVFNISIDGGSLARPRLLERVDSSEGFRLRHEYDGHTGAPRWYYIARSDVSVDGEVPLTYTARFIPVPDDTYDVEAQYMYNPTDMASPGDESVIPYEYQEAIPAWAAGKLFLKEFSISQKANEQFSLYMKVLEQARKDLRSFNLDETVAWGRRHPLRGYWSQSWDPRFRMPPTLG